VVGGRGVTVRPTQNGPALRGSGDGSGAAEALRVQDDNGRFPFALSVRQTWEPGTVPVHKEPRVNPRLQQVVVDLLDEFPVETVVDGALAEVRAEVPAFRAVDEDRMREDVSGALALAREALQNGDDESGQERDALRTIGATRAEQGVGLDAMLTGFRIVARTVIDTILDLAREHDVDSEAALELTRAVWVHCDAAAAALSAGHRAFTEAPGEHRLGDDEAALRRLVRGSLGDEAVATACAELGLDPHDTFAVVLAGGGLTDVRRRLVASYPDPAADRVVGLATTTPLGPWGVPVGYGDRAAPADLRRSYQGAVEAWEMATAFGLAEPQHPDEVQLLRAVHALPELGDRFVERCLGHLDDVRRTTTRETLDAWFAAHGSTDAAADTLFVHRNTLRYRLRTFSEATGLALDRTEDAFVVWWALRRLDELDHAG
jgi:hypothetical protein